MEKARASRNRTLTLPETERAAYRARLLFPDVSDRDTLSLAVLENKTVCADLFAVLGRLPAACADVLIIDPPYNLDKDFHGFKFAAADDAGYLSYLRSWFPALLRTLKGGGTVYLCGDWKSSSCLYQVMSENLAVRNRITWQREKGRGALTNWKNACEDIWFGTSGDGYYFDIESVKQKRLVLAPYREEGVPKDWQATPEGNFRLTHPGNFWDDISVPYWSMPENTDHPTQKPEKLIAKLLLASCPPDGLVLDPFLGSGTTAVVAKKLGRRYIGVEMNETYCLWAEKRLALAEADPHIQGYCDGVFWERNTARLQREAQSRKKNGGNNGKPE